MVLIVAPHDLSLLASAMLVAIGLGMLVGAPSDGAAGIVLYGADSGIRSIARGQSFWPCSSAGLTPF